MSGDAKQLNYSTFDRNHLSVNNGLELTLTTGDSDYEDLPSPGDGDDATDGTYQSIISHKIPYSKIYDPPKSFKDPTNRWLIPHSPITVKIINTERNTTTHLLNPNLYTIEVRQSTYKWIVKRRYNHFYHLHQQLILFRAALRLPLPTKKHRERRKSFGPANRRRLPRFPLRPEMLISEDAVQKRSDQLQEYLQNCLKITMYRTHYEMMSFLELSPLSLVDELGHKGKEFLVMKRAGGFRRATCCLRVENLITDLSGHWRKRWLIVKDSCVVYLRPKDGRIRAVMLIDQGFKAVAGLHHVGVHHGVRISNLSRDLYLKCWTSRKAIELADYLVETSRTYAQDFASANRYDSFAPIRSNTSAQWFIDGASYFEAVSKALELAKEEIFITDWWLSPEVYMRRPVIHCEQWRLDRILQRKASQGVRVYVLVYKEVEIGVSINSLYTKQALMKLHPNIRVLRHPDPARGGPLMWSHHEKIVVIDQSYAFVGGIDLCFGRWDDSHHRLTDLGGISITVNDDRNAIDRLIRNSTSPFGAQGRSLSQPSLVHSHSEQINYVNLNQNQLNIPVKESETGVKFDIFSDNDDNNEYRKDNNDNNKENGAAIDTKVINHKKSSLEDSGVVDTNVADGVDSNYAEPSLRMRIRSKFRSKKLMAVARFQTLRRFSQKSKLSASASELSNYDFDESDSVDTEPARIKKSSSDQALNNLGLQGGTKLWYGKDYVNFIVKDFEELDQPFKDMVDRNNTPRMGWHDLSCMVTGAAARDVARHFIERWNFTKFEKAKFHAAYHWLIPKSYSTVDSIVPPKFLLRSHHVSCQVVRSVANWSIGIKTCDTSILEAYIDMINNAKHYIYIENQFFITQSRGKSSNQSDVLNSIGEALYWRIIRAYRDHETFRVYVLFPLLPAFPGQIGTNSGTAIHAITHYNYTTICRGNNSLLFRLQREIGDTSRFITFYGLRNYGELHGKLLTELVYVHSKLLLVDDKRVIIGSANINDRSMLGCRDSEVAVVISDAECEPSVMNGEPYESGKFCGSLRRMLMREHLGVIDTNPTKIDIRDPVCDQFYKNVWIATAAKNSSIYEKVFAVVPTDEVRNFAQLTTYLSKPKLAQTDYNEAKKCLSEIRGHLVLTPLFFLCDQDLTPSAGTKEAFMPATLWT